jgi:hypothetical protein
LPRNASDAVIDQLRQQREQHQRGHRHDAKARKGEQAIPTPPVNEPSPDAILLNRSVGSVF